MYNFACGVNFCGKKSEGVGNVICFGKISFADSGKSRRSLVLHGNPVKYTANVYWPVS